MLLQPGKGVDIFSAIEQGVDFAFSFCVMENTFKELESLVNKTKKGSDKFNAKLGYIMAKQKGLKTISSTKNHVDDAIIEVITTDDYVATLDKKLQKRVLEKGAKIIVVKGKNQIVVK